MATLHKYVPQTAAGNLIVVPTHGDCLAVERMVDSKRARAADLNQVDRLEGLEPVPQEFHHRGLMLQVGLLQCHYSSPVNNVTILYKIICSTNCL